MDFVQGLVSDGGTCKERSVKPGQFITSPLKRIKRSLEIWGTAMRCGQRGGGRAVGKKGTKGAVLRKGM